MKKGDIVQHKKHKEQIAVCTTNEMPSGYLGILQLDNGEDIRLLTRANRWQVVEFADGHINRALFPKNEEAEERRFNEEYYGMYGHHVRAVDIPINADRMGEYAQVVMQRPRWEGNPFPDREIIQWYGDPIDRWNEV